MSLLNKYLQQLFEGPCKGVSSSRPLVWFLCVPSLSSCSLTCNLPCSTEWICVQLVPWWPQQRPRKRDRWVFQDFKRGKKPITLELIFRTWGLILSRGGVDVGDVLICCRIQTTDPALHFLLWLEALSLSKTPEEHCKLPSLLLLHGF